MPSDFDAIVIGAGPAGSSAAILLAGSGWRVAMVEKQNFPRRKVCGECIAASNLPLLDALGIGKAFAGLAGQPLRHVALMAGDQTIRAEFPPYAQGKQAWGTVLGREYLDALLLQQALHCGVEVFQPWAARVVEGGPGQFRCHIGMTHSVKSGVLTAPVLIDAHGSWEKIPVDGTKQRLPQRGSDLFAFKANFTQANLEPGLLPVLAFPGGYGGMVVGGHATATLAFCMRRDMLARCRKMLPGSSAAQAAAAYVANACQGVRAMLSGARQQGTWLSTGPIRPGIRLQRSGHAFLVGNAAGEAHPIVGEGISMAIQSAWLLAQKLGPHRVDMADKETQASLQQDYARAWLQHFAPRIRLAAIFAHIAMRPAPIGCALPILKACPRLLTHAARWSGKAWCAPLQEPVA
jgi:2-polyprenyl-6-methoxyphenol hydroxylase-like FAD-dependent oxidoreductase